MIALLIILEVKIWGPVVADFVYHLFVPRPTTGQLLMELCLDGYTCTEEYWQDKDGNRFYYNGTVTVGPNYEYA